jgi:uncharacterized membrane protein YphA (DoxX/SURF4 family)
MGGSYPGKKSRPNDAKTVNRKELNDKEVQMESATLRPVGADRGVASERGVSVVDRLKSDPAYQAFWLLRIGFAALPILFGLDKFFDVLVDWEIYLAGWINDIVPGDATDAMHIVGVVEIVAGIAVALKPRYAAYVVAAWLGGIIINLLTYSGYYDIALRDFGLLVGAVTLGRLAAKYDPPLFGSRA